MVDVHQIHLELILRLGVVAAIDLRVSRQTRLHLQPQIERGQFLAVLLRNLRALRARAHNAHVPFEDVEQLRQLIEADRADDSTDRRDPIVVLAGQTGAALLRVHDHAAQF